MVRYMVFRTGPNRSVHPIPSWTDEESGWFCRRNRYIGGGRRKERKREKGGEGEKALAVGGWRRPAAAVGVLSRSDYRPLGLLQERKSSEWGERHIGGHVASGGAADVCRVAIVATGRRKPCGRSRSCGIGATTPIHRVF